jgi:hypothetical protein
MAAYCLPDVDDPCRSKHTRELDHLIAATFGLWEVVIPESRLFTL